MSQSALKLARGARRQDSPRRDEDPTTFSNEEVADLQFSLEQQLDAVLQRNEKLEQLNSCFEAALNHMGRGLSMFDSEQRLVVCNKAYANIYELPPELTHPGTPLAEIVRYHMSRSAGQEPAGDAPAEWIKQQVARLQQGGHLEQIQSLPDGRIIRVTYEPLAAGGWVDMQEDITAQRQAGLGSLPDARAGHWDRSG